MKTIWKWALGLLVLILIAGAFATLGFFWRTHALAADTTAAPFHHGWNGGPMMRGDDFGWHSGPMMRGGRGFVPFGGLFFFRGLGWLLRLAFFGLILYGAYWLGRRNARVVVEPRSPAPVSPPASPPEPPADQAPPAE